MNLRLLTAAVTLIAVAGCNLTEQSAPDLTGPSTLGRSVVVTASPDRMLYDGSSQATITATVRNAAGATEPNVAVRWQAVVVQIVNGNRTLLSVPVEPSPQVSTTGSNGTATTVVRAPVTPDIELAGAIMLMVSATPIGDDASQLAPGLDAKPRTVTVELVQPTGADAPDRLPVADFTMSPPSANIFQTVTLDASLSRDEGVVCGDRCTYVWEFSRGGVRDHSTKTGRIATTSFSTPGVWTVTLYVTDERGGTGTKAQSLTVSGPAAPTANFTVVPASPTAGQVAVLDGSTSTVGAGARIVLYEWNFATEGVSSNSTTPILSHTFPTAGTHVVVLTVTDDLGRTATRSTSITVQ